MRISFTASNGSAAAAGGLFQEPFRARLEHARVAATEALLREKNAAGWWVGELSASALSTATAVTALMLVARDDAAASERVRPFIQRGYEWLVDHQNTDGGWGDTTASFSNLSTTVLVWAALGLRHDRGTETVGCVAAAERWLRQVVGALAPEELVAALERRYGNDRTFSIPIVTMCALCGRLGPGEEGWRHVRQLPFELAALPQRWFGALQLPVVSYALPALIAIGQIRHGMRPTGNPPLRWLRDRCRARTLEKLAHLQPASGGFLEATPLTSFVVMSLAALGLTAHPVVQRSVGFLETSARPDGSWPIDTNLATWVTTLSVNALGSTMTDVARRVSGGTVCPADDEPSLRSRAGLPELMAIRDWLLRQQFHREHPYTLSPPGGWAWTDRPGGVPDADDTAGALLALSRLDPDAPAVRAAARAGIEWLLGRQNRDGGIPTFCRGWGRLPFDRSSPDLTAHALRAWLQWRNALPAALHGRLDAAIRRAARFLRTTQRVDGAWIPLWFGHQEDPADENPLYGTARVIPALCALECAGSANMAGALERALDWLVAKQNPDGGWSGARGADSSVEETGLALEALAAAWETLRVRSAAIKRDTTDPNHPPEGVTTNASAFSVMQIAIDRGGAWLASAVENERWRTPAPIGLYFAKLWYHERLYPLIFATGALTHLTSIYSRPSNL